MRTLNFELKLMCRRNRDGSYATQRDRERVLDLVAGLDPVSLLRNIRVAQGVLSEMSARGPRDVAVSTSESPAIATYLQSLATAWKEGEVRPTHQRKATEARWWRTRADPFEHAWPVVEGWLVAEPTATAKELMNRLAQAVPDTYASKAQLRTLQRRIKTWRAEKAKDLILGKLRKETREDVEG